MIKYRVFEPAEEPSNVVVMGNILGGMVDDTGDAVGDHAYRAQWLADSCNSLVIAYKRPYEEARMPAYTAGRIYLSIHRELETYKKLPLVLAGASAGALSVLDLARTERFDVDAISVFDPIGIKKYKVIDGYRSWAQYQLNTERHKSDEDRNQHPLPAPTPDTQVAALRSIGRTARDMFHNTRSWKQPLALNHLTHIATSSSFQSVTVRAEFVGNSFTASREETEQIVDELTGIRPAAWAPFQVVYSKDKLHSWTDDPARFADTVHKTLALDSTED